MTDREIIDKVWNKRLESFKKDSSRGLDSNYWDRVLIRYARWIERARIKIEMLDWYHAQGKE